MLIMSGKTRGLNAFIVKLKLINVTIFPKETIQAILEKGFENVVSDAYN